MKPFTDIGYALLFCIGALGFCWGVSRFFKYSRAGQKQRDNAWLAREITKLEENETLRNWPE